MNIFKAFLLLTVLGLSACAHYSPLNTKLSDEWTPLSPKQQKRTVRKQTKKLQVYHGLHLSFEAEIVFVNSKIQNNNLKINSQFKNWSVQEALSEKAERKKYLESHAEFFLTFYSPKTKRNKLSQAAADWKAVLKVDGLEYEGKIEVRKNITHHNQIYYPNLSPWSTPYLVTFPVATKILDANKFEVLILGPEGMASFKY